MANIERNCTHCNKLFITTTSYIKRGYGKFCSLSCSASYGAASRSKECKSPNMNCFYCNKKFYLNDFRKEQSKSKMFFCSRKCKDKAQSINSGEQFNLLRPDHYGQTQSYRRIKLESMTNLKCEECGYNRCPEILQVHHIDRNRENSDLLNLKLLCPTCHDEDHFLQRDGRWGYNRNGGP